MNIDVSLFESQNICLAPIDHEKDAEIESSWAPLGYAFHGHSTGKMGKAQYRARGESE
ncbi:MAG: hypothetical protein JXA78_03395 [Anaerolineales bacterium]|nr:hypothetical protein [Anaerolineales bacterium]